MPNDFSFNSCVLKVCKWAQFAGRVKMADYLLKLKEQKLNKVYRKNGK